MRIGSFKASIQIANRSAVEYEVRTQASTAECYIEAQEGQSFAVTWSEDHHAHGDTEGRIHLDGAPEPAAFGRLWGSRRKKSVSAVNVSEDHARALTFAVITTADGDGLSSAALSFSDALGTITLKLYRGTRRTKPALSPFVPGSAAALVSAVQDETQAKSSKASFVTSLGELVPRRKKRTRSTFVRKDSKATPFVTFTFVYRSRAVLQAMDLIPVSPHPYKAPARGGPGIPAVGATITLSSDDDDVEDFADVRQARVQLQLALDKAKKAKSRIKTHDKPIKSEGDVKPSTKHKLKSEPGLEPRVVKKRRIDEKGRAVIDLSD